MTRASVPGAQSPYLAEGPARDARFIVVDRWIDCANFAPDDPLRETEFFHRQMNEEVDSLECSALNLSQFPDVEWALRMALARQCADEARHAAMFRRIFLARGGRLGQYPVLNFQYRIVAGIGSLVGRLAVQNRSFEAGGLDAIQYGIEEAQRRGDQVLVDLYQAQQADEISHVRFANAAIHAATERDPRSVMLIGVALNNAARAFGQVMGVAGTSGVGFPADVAGRQEAGFSSKEVMATIALKRESTGSLQR